MQNKQPGFLSRIAGFRIEWLLAGCWALVQGLLLYQHGIETAYEATKYIAEADNLIEKGTVSTPNFWLYSTQIFLIAAIKQIHAGYWLVALVHWMMNALATAALFRLITSLSDRVTAAIITLVFIFNFPIQTYNSFLQTESLFHSFTILFSCYLLQLRAFNLARAIQVFLFLLLICFTRPTGLLWVPGTLLYLFFRFFRRFSFGLKLGITLGGSLGFLFFLNQALGSGGELDFMLPFRDERIICGVPTLPHFVDIKVSDNPNSLQGLWYYITHNFSQFIRLAAIRSRAFFGMQRDYYSSGHNVYLAIYFYPFLLLALGGIVSWWKQSKYLLLYCLPVIGLTWLTVILTCDDWHNRFFLTIVPYIYILSVPMVKLARDRFHYGSH